MAFRFAIIINIKKISRRGGRQSTFVVVVINIVNDTKETDKKSSLENLLLNLNAIEREMKQTKKKMPSK